MSLCKRCKGDGVVKMAGSVGSCLVCNGSGWVETAEEKAVLQVRILERLQELQAEAYAAGHAEGFAAGLVEGAMPLQQRIDRALYLLEANGCQDWAVARVLRGKPRQSLLPRTQSK